MEKINNLIAYMIKYSIYALFLVIVVWLFMISGFSTSYINTFSEYTYYTADNIWVHFLGFCIFLLLMYGITTIVKHYDLYEINDKNFAYIRNSLLFCISIIGVIIVICTQTIPWADQKKIMDAAYGLRHGDYGMFLKGGYIQSCQNQKGIVLFIYFLSMIVGDYNYIAFQIFNILALVLVYKELSDIVKYLGMNKICQLVILAFGIIFLPLSLYTTFVYGTIIAFALALMAVKYELLYFNNYKWKEVLISSVAITLSVMLKSNSLIFMIAMIIYALLKLARIHKIRAAMPVVLMLFVYFTQSIVMDFYYREKIGEPMEKGISSWAYIAMGLQEGYKADGWWNRYNSDTYYSNDCDSDRQAEESKKYIKERLEYFMEDNEYAAKFIGHKIASQWNNPTFQCCWIINKQSSNIQQPNWIKGMYNIQGQDKLSKIFNSIQFIILMGCLLFVTFDHDKLKLNWLMLQIMVIGGFLFHILWEAKCQYTLPYFLLLVPISIKGYSNITYLSDYTHEKIKNKKYINAISIFIILLIGLAVFISRSDSKIINNLVKIDDNMEEYTQYLMFNTTDKVKDGNYGIYSYLNNEMSITCLDLSNETNSKIDLNQKQQDNIYITTKGGKVYFGFNDTSLYLDLSKNEEIENGIVQAYKKNDTSAQQWVIKRAKENKDTYYILIGKHSALTYDKDIGICINDFEGSDAQKWIIR